MIIDDCQDWFGFFVSTQSGLLCYWDFSPRRVTMVLDDNPALGEDIVGVFCQTEKGIREEIGSLQEKTHDLTVSCP